LTRDHAYLFAARGIQHWILEGGRLRDIAAASNLLARCFGAGDDLLAPILKDAGLAGASFSRRAGGAFMLHTTDTERDRFDRFRAAWRLRFMRTLPGLEVVEAWGEGDSEAAARASAYNPQPGCRSAGRENGAASLPPYGHMLTAFSPLTGRPAVPAHDREPIDAITAAKRSDPDAREAVGLKFLPDDQREAWRWPNRMDDDPDGIGFPFIGEDRWVAVMHADISALGRFYAAIGENAGAQPVGMMRDAAGTVAT
jgi:hypothetical protein